MATIWPEECPVNSVNPQVEFFIYDNNLIFFVQECEKSFKTIAETFKELRQW